MKRKIILAIIVLLATQKAFSQLVVEVNKIQDVYNSGDINYHHYKRKILLCKSDKYTVDEVYKIFISQSKFLAPVYDEQQPAFHGCTLLLNISMPGIAFPGIHPIKVIFDKANRKITNYTMPKHILHPGKVERQIVQRGDEIFLETDGIGAISIDKFFTPYTGNCTLAWFTANGLTAAERLKFGAPISQFAAWLNEKQCIVDDVWEPVDRSFFDFLNKKPFNIDKSHKPYKYALLYATPNDQLALLGKYPIGVTVTILNNKTGKTILCKTASVKKYESEFTGEAVATILDKPIFAKKSEEHSFTAVFSSKNVGFQMINRTLIQDEVKIQNIDNLIKQGGYLVNLLKQYDQAKFEAGYLDILKSKTPIVHHLNISGADVNVVTYKFNENETGPRFIEVNSKIFPLSGQCSFLDFQVYKYGNNYFIKSNSGACETGYIIAEIFEIREDSVIKEFSDSGYSN